LAVGFIHMESNGVFRLWPIVVRQSLFFDITKDSDALLVKQRVVLGLFIFKVLIKGDSQVTVLNRLT
jgi:hypothetical protein